MFVKNNRWVLYVGVIALVVLLALLEANVSFLEKGLLATPFLVIVAAAAIIGDLISSILAVVLGAIAVNYVMHPVGLKFNTTMVLRMLQFIVSGAIVYLLAYRGNTLHQSNAKLIESTKKLQSVIRRLKIQAKGNAQQVEKLNTVNGELRELVDEFMADDAYWESRWSLRNKR